MDAVTQNQVEYYEARLAFEIDSWDLLAAQDAGQAVVVLDARSQAGYEAEHIRNALSLPHRLMTAENTAHFDREALYVVYCDGLGCNASTQGTLKMARLGFRVKELIGGLEWWKRGGYPVQSSGALSPIAKPECTC